MCRELQSNNADILREAALAGGGVTLLADWLVRDDVSAGRLTRVLEQYEVNPGSASTSINALYPAQSSWFQSHQCVH